MKCNLLDKYHAIVNIIHTWTTSSNSGVVYLDLLHEAGEESGVVEGPGLPIVKNVLAQSISLAF